LENIGEGLLHACTFQVIFLSLFNQADLTVGMLSMHSNLLFLAGVLRSLCAMVLLHAGISNMKYRYGWNGQDTDDMG
jgi:hypothetical protein